MDWKEFLKLTSSKIVLTFVILISALVVIGIPVEQYELCEMGAECSKVISFRNIQKFFGSTEFIGKGVWLLWHVYIFELLASYLISSAMIFAYKKYKK